MTSVLIVLANIVVMEWVLVAVMLRFGIRHPLIRSLYHELRPFYLVSLFVYYGAPVVFNGPLDIWWQIGLVCNVANWFLFKNIDDDDDRWKRRRRKLAEKVAAVGGRLTVVAGDAR